MAGRLASQVRGPSEARFREADGTGERCRAAVEELRWPKGFACPLCGSREAGASAGDGRRPRKKEVRKLVAERPASTGRLVTDGLGCRTAAAEAGLGHAATATGGGQRGAGPAALRRGHNP